MSEFGNDIFASAAGYYAKYRPGYPQRLFLDLVRAFRLNGKGVLLDLGCGTGEIAIPLAKYFEKVLAIDPDPDMLATGQNKAERLKIANITWQKGSSKELSSLKGPFKLVAMGWSFHWMDQKKVLRELYRLIKEGGLAVIGTEAVEEGSIEAKKDEIIQKLIKKYLGPQRRAGNKIYKASTKRYEDLMPNSKFSNFQTRFYSRSVVMNIDQEIGNLYSMSWANPNLFGGQLASFEAEIRQQLEALKLGGKFHNKICFGVYTLAK